MLTNTERVRLMRWTKRTGREIMQLYDENKLLVECEGHEHGVRMDAEQRAKALYATHLIHTHPNSNLPFSGTDLMTFLHRQHLRVMEVICYDTAYRLRKVKRHAPLDADLDIDEIMSAPVMYSEHPEVIRWRRQAMIILCERFGWQFEEFNPFERR